MTSLPANDATRHSSLPGKNGRAVDLVTSGVSLRALSRASSVCLGAREYRREARSSTSSPHQKYRRPSFAPAPSRSQFGDFFLRKHRLALVSRLGSSVSWLRQPLFEAYRKVSRKLLIHHLIVVLGLTLNVYRCSLARATGHFCPHGRFCLVQRERPGKPSPRGQGWHNQVSGLLIIELCRHSNAITLFHDSTRIRHVPSPLRT